MAAQPLNVGVEGGGAGPGGVPRPWLGVRFVCANKYVRVYRDADGTRYTARCPSCGRCVVFRVGEGGTASRQFEVSCR
ncbi:MAG TPA: hypothetical protein VFF69_04085 [Phycisphaerales bacterium]|nr:hypothetical protein [Phycisphaerales bacterium]